MKKNINHRFKIILLFISFIVLNSCALKSITSEYTFVKTDLDKIEIDNLGDGNILIYNGANIFHKLDNTARLNVWINHKALGQIKPREYVIIHLKNGKYDFKALHIDLVKMTSNHEVIVNKSTKIIKIKPTVSSNKLEVVNVLPNNFDKFTYTVQR